MSNNEQSTIDIILIKILVPALTAGLIGMGALIWNLVSQETAKEYRLKNLEEQVIKLQTKQETLTTGLQENKAKVKIIENDLDYIKRGIEIIMKDLKEMKQ